MSSSYRRTAYRGAATPHGFRNGTQYDTICAPRRKLTSRVPQARYAHARRSTEHPGLDDKRFPKRTDKTAVGESYDVFDGLHMLAILRVATFKPFESSRST